MDFFLTSAGLPALGTVLPLGISFFTFTQLAFLVDAYRGVAREYNPIHYLLFVSYFPHLIAGPILHHKEMMPQFGLRRIYRPQGRDLAIGLSIFAVGLAKKLLIADTVAPAADGVFNNPDGLSWAEAWVGAVAYAVQIYFDFSGYSDMAIGLSRLVGVRLPLNFNSPYKSADIIDFWRRWHMTLSRFLRDYLYIPLGGGRCGGVRRYAKLMVTMLLGGLWHGAHCMAAS
jgi:D-alanyl-lipoteichoic acid acyltransferase DltB (MBOAT superfamily)